MSQASNKKKRKRNNLVDTAEVGMKPIGGVETLRFSFHNFEQLSYVRGEFTSSPTLCAHHNNWRMIIYPGGNNQSSKDEEHISCYLYWVGDSEQESPWAQATFRCADFQRTTSLWNKLEEGWGYRDFCTREKAISDFLQEGSFTIEADIQMGGSTTDERWYPQKLQEQAILINLYQSSDFSDVAFTVESTTFKAHKFVLSERCKALYEIVSAKSESAPSESIPIIGSSHDMFKTLLEYVYTVKEPVLEDVEVAKDILVVADRFGVIGLKMLAESTIAYNFLSVDNLVDLLVFAHSRSCPLLKEQCMKFYTMNAESCQGSDGWKLIRASPVLLHELVSFLSITSKTIADKSKVETLDVGTLRERLEQAGLDLDGSREVLIKRLKEHDTKNA